MPFEGKPLREVTAAELRQLVTSGMTEHLHLDYKSDVYEDNDRGCREHLQDICMFANAQGGLILIGISEQRDEDGQPTGTPDPEAVLGIELPNPEAVLQSYDARVTSCIEERLRIESWAIPVGENRHVLAIRVPNSAAKPHCVRYKGTIYFPSRRERNRYQLSLREIKDLAMRTASQLERSEDLIKKAISYELSRGGESILLAVGLIPIFFQDFSVNIKNPAVQQAMRLFDTSGQNGSQIPRYSFEGLVRPEDGVNAAVTLMRNGLIRLRRILQTAAGNREGVGVFYPIVFDRIIRQFVIRAQHLYAIAPLSGPVLLAARIYIPAQLVAQYGDIMHGDFHTAQVGPGDFDYSLLIDTFEEPAERILLPFCDHIHQTFGQEGSPNFDAEGNWVGRN